MIEKVKRSYNCKDEELLVICTLVLLSFKRDLSVFTGYSPKMNGDYVSSFEAKIKAATELLMPETETVAKKLITEQLYGILDGLITPINYLTGYLDIAKKELKISAADFGLKTLRKACAVSDLEGALDALRLVNANIQKYKTSLVPLGLTEELMAKFSTASEPLTALKEQQYSLLTNRMKIVQENTGLLNDLFEQLTEIFKVGKILFKATDPVKLKEYTFSELLKQVRRKDKAPTPDADAPAPTA
ncbi:MAG: hypothetical protein WBI06_14605 [Paludibacter sp.]